MKTLDLVSPTRNENYTILDVLKKGLQRAAITCDQFNIELLHTCFYGSKDFALRVQNLESSKSLWANSVNLRIEGMIPIHATKDGKLSVGFGCGCDTRHGGQFPSESAPDNENWAEYKNEEVGQLTAWLATGDSSGNVDVVSLAEVMEDEACRRELLYIMKDLMARAALNAMGLPISIPAPLKVRFMRWLCLVACPFLPYSPSFCKRPTCPDDLR